jgi:hypothetical protein
MTYNFGVRLLVAVFIVPLAAIVLAVAVVGVLLAPILVLIPGIPVTINGRRY